MTAYPYKISFIIAARPGCVPHSALLALQKISLPPDQFEVLISYGRRPSLQRNEAAARATGDYLYFLDDDSQIAAENLELIPQVLRDFGIPPQYLVMGGAVTLPVGVDGFQSSLSRTMSSPLGFGPYRFRYSAAGAPRFASERELLSANLIVSRSLFLKSKGFDARLYPGEECHWLKRMSANGIKPLYHPGLVCYRPQRADYPSTFRMGFSYGEGRARHFFERFHGWDALLAFPSALVLVTLLAVLSGKLIWAFALGLYLLTVLAASVGVAVAQARNGGTAVPCFFRALAIFPTIHYGYGLGFGWGLIKKAMRLAAAEVDAEVYLDCEPFIPRSAVALP